MAGRQVPLNAYRSRGSGVTDFLPFARPVIGEDEIAEVADTLRSGWLSTGPKTRRFEQEFASYLGVRHALAVNSATAGLHLALEASGIGPGDRVLTTTYTFTATAEVVRYLGADPVFVDIDAATMNMNLDQAADLLESDSGIKAIVPVHFAGLACDMKRLSQLAAKHSVPLIEDAAHALPTTFDGTLIGSFGAVTVFSFYVTKTITTGEGGMVVTNDDGIAERVRVMRLHGINRDVFDRYTSKKPAWYYEVVAPGFKYNMPDVAAALGIHQLAKCDDFQRRREEIADRYNAAFSDIPVCRPAGPRQGDKHAWHLYVLRLDTSRLQIDRAGFIEEMLKLGIGTSVHFIPLHRQPYWRERYQLDSGHFPVADGVYEQAVSLPIYPGLSDGDVQRVIDAVTSILREHEL